MKFVLLSLLAFFASVALAGFFSDESDTFGDDDTFGVGGIGGSGIDSFGGDNFFGDNDSKGWKRVKGNPNAKYYVKSWSQVKSKGYPQKKEKKILNDRKKWEGDRKATDGQEKAKELDKQVEGEGAQKNAGDDQPFGKEFDKFVSLD